LVQDPSAVEAPLVMGASYDDMVAHPCVPFRDMAAVRTAGDHADSIPLSLLVSARAPQQRRKRSACGHVPRKEWPCKQCLPTALAEEPHR
jgi:hypothetical protein